MHLCFNYKKEVMVAILVINILELWYMLMRYFLQGPSMTSLFIYLGFYVAFNTVQVISRRVVGRAEETSTYSSLGFCTVNCRPTAQRWEARVLPPCHRGPFNYLFKTVIIVNKFGKKFDVKFNPNKGKYIIFGNSKSIAMSIKFNYTHLSPFESANYIGVIIGKNCSEAQIKIAKTQIKRRFNILYRMFTFCSVKVKHSLFKYFCMALYGYVLWDFRSSQMLKLFICWRK